MIKHIVLLKLKPFAEGASREQNMAAMKRELLALVAERGGGFPRIKNSTVLRTELSWNNGYLKHRQA